jgi:sulfite reductase alpha subunit
VSETPLLDEAEKGPWPSVVTEMKRAEYEGLLGIYELAYKDKVTHWAHGGMVGYPGYDAGVIGRLSDRPDIMRDSHTLRIIQTAGWIYSTDKLRKLSEIWDKYGTGLINFHGATADIQLLGCPTDNIEPCFDELAKEHWDFGGSAGDYRTPSCCIGPIRCEMAMIDAPGILHTIMTDPVFLEDMHRPRFPYKFKIKISGCPTDCSASVARADLAIVGTWKDAMKVDQEEVKNYANAGVDINHIVSKCPADAMEWDGNELKVDNDDCVRCMYCLQKMSKALRPGDDRGATILMGGRARGRYGAFLGWVLVPFMKVSPPYKEIFPDLVTQLTDWWDEHGRSKERIGETIYRIGTGKFLYETGIKALPTMVQAPRSNPFWFYWPGEVKE